MKMIQPNRMKIRLAGLSILWLAASVITPLVLLSAEKTISLGQEIAVYRAIETGTLGASTQDAVGHELEIDAAFHRIKLEHKQRTTTGIALLAILEALALAGFVYFVWRYRVVSAAQAPRSVLVASGAQLLPSLPDDFGWSSQERRRGAPEQEEPVLV